MNDIVVPAAERAWPRWASAPILLLVWSIPGLAALSFYYLNQVVTAQPMAWSYAVTSTLPNWYIWALLTPVIIWLARSYPIERDNWLRTVVAIHIPAMLAALLIHSLANLLIFRAVGIHDTINLGLYEVHFTSRVHANIVTYWMILGIFAAYNYYRELLTREQQAATLQVQLAQANLKALKMQLHPHFLFNTLNSVAALVRKGDNKTAIKMLVRLGDFLRLALENKGVQEIPIEQELDFLERYLDIERIRFGDRLFVSVRCEPDAAGAYVPNMILQPLVENAIHHGIGPNADQGRIEVEATRADDTLRMVVRDNGTGMPKEAERRMRKGVGIANTSERLLNLYGEDHALSFRNLNEGGLEVELEIPFVAAPVIEAGNGISVKG
ncbi:MAG: histidine kinase [Rhodothermales bacterium]|nr:histidine kinase [Rhodothermales bacterium]